MKIKINELQGAALDWAVAKCKGFVPFTDGISWIIDDEGDYKQLPKYSTDYAQGGPIIERDRIDILFQEKGLWLAVGFGMNEAHGQTPLIAAMRCYVASKLGDELELPTGL